MLLLKKRSKFSKLRTKQFFNRVINASIIFIYSSLNSLSEKNTWVSLEKQTIQERGREDERALILFASGQPTWDRVTGSCLSCLKFDKLMWPIKKTTRRLLLPRILFSRISSKSTTSQLFLQIIMILSSLLIHHKYLCGFQPKR